MCSLGESFVRSVKAEDEEAGRGGEAARRKFLSRSGVKQKNGWVATTRKPSLFSSKPESGMLYGQKSFTRAGWGAVDGRVKRGGSPLLQKAFPSLPPAFPS